MRDRLLHGEVEQRELQQRAVALQVEEAGTGDLGAALDVDGAEQLAELEVVARLEALRREVARGAHFLQDGEVLLAADRRLEVDEVRDLQPQRIDLLAGLISRLLRSLDLLGQLLGLGHERVQLLLSRCAGGVVRCLLEGALQRADLLAQHLLLVAQLVEGRLRLALGDVGRDEVVDEFHALPAATLGLADPVGVGSQDGGIDHGLSLGGGVRCSPFTLV